MPSRSFVGRSFVMVAALAATACGGKETTSPRPGPSAIALISGNNQTGTVGQALPQALVVKVTDKAGAGVGGVSVTWSVTSGGGSLSNGATLTDAQGQAQVTWTAGTVAGSSNNSASATVSGLTGSPVTFTASATAGPPAQLVAVSGNNQAGVVAQALGQQLVAAARDQYSNPTAGVTVAWTVAAGGGSVSATSTSTDAQGHAAVTWSLGTTAGTNRDTVNAAAAGLAGSPVTFAASANPAAATQFALSSGDNQSGTVAQALAQPLVVRAQDQYGNNVSGVTVTWAVTSGGGSVSSPSSGTDAQGQASISWTLGATAGVQHASATVTGLTGSPVAFTATALAGPAAQIAAASGNNQTGQVDADLASPLVVLVTDAHSNPVAGVNVTWAATAGGGSITPTNSTTDAAGHASATRKLGQTAGTNKDTATATVVGLTGSPVTFSATPLAGPATQIAAAGGNNQSAPAGTALPVAYSVKAADAFGNGVSGVTVDWAVTSGGGSITPVQNTTDAAGLARATHTLGATVGAQTATATSTALTGSPVGFSATALPNATISGTITVAAGFLTPPAVVTSIQRVGSAGIPLLPPPRTSLISPRSVMTPRVSTRRGAPRLPRYTPDELLVTYHPTALQAPPFGSVALSSASAARSFAAAIRSRLQTAAIANHLEVAGVAPTILTARLRVPDSTNLEAVARILRSDPAVLSVDRNPLVYLDDLEARNKQAPKFAGHTSQLTTLPSEPLYPWQAWHYGLSDLPSAWDITTGSASVLVAVIDNGIRFDHPALSGRLTSDGFDFTSSISVPLCGGGMIDNADDGNGYDSDPTQPADYSFDANLICASGPNGVGGHGLHVAATIGAAGNDGVGVTGVNWTVNIRPIRALGVVGVGTGYDIAQGILYAAGLPADNGAGGTVQATSSTKIISMSLGAATGSTAESLAVVSANSAGSLIIAAAGNESSTTPGYPAAYPGVLAVSSVGPDGILASYSNFASSSGIAAPGGDLSDGDTTFGVFSAMWDFAANSPTYQTINGTSQATPHVSGVAALLLAQNSLLTAAQLRSRLTTYAMDVGVAGPDDIYGAGILNARNSLTQSFSPPRNLYARLYNAATGAIVQTVPVALNGAYSFTGLFDGGYYVLAGLDQSGDQQIGVPDPGLIARIWGAFGGSSTPSIVTVAGAGTYPASFTVGLPIEVESNNTIATPDVLLVGGYVSGVIADPSTDVDVFRVFIPQSGQYTFETSGYVGACGFALEEDTVLGLYDLNGTLITSNDDVNAGSFNFCSRVTSTLAPGTYYVGVFGNRGGQYTLQARSGN